jgi:organic hydroperoxide reductase OsmC/OhrA
VGDKVHSYQTDLTWIGHTEKVSSFKRHNRAYVLESHSKPPIPGSSDPGFRGDPSRWNPEDLLVAALSSCHHLFFMYLCGQAGIEVLRYEDHADGTMEENPDGSGQFTQVTLRPKVRLAPGSDVKKAEGIHHASHEKCFIARSVTFPVRNEPVFEVAAATQ